MDEKDFILSLKRQWNEACLAAGIPAISDDNAATILATVYLYGNNEAMVMNPIFIEDLRYIKKRYKIEGGETPDADFAMLLKERISEMEEYDSVREKEKPSNGTLSRQYIPPQHIPPYARDLFMSRYGIKLIN